MNLAVFKMAFLICATLFMSKQAEGRTVPLFVHVEDVRFIDVSENELELQIDGYLPNGCYSFPLYYTVKHEQEQVIVSLWSEQKSYRFCSAIIQPFSKRIIIDNRFDPNNEIELIFNESTHQEFYKRILLN